MANLKIGFFAFNRYICRLLFFNKSINYYDKCKI
nr:MAG TPA: hypothetical protein [Caudoviricetes sp.]